MATRRQLLHLLTSTDSAKAFPIAEQQQQSGAGHPLLVLSAEAVHLVPPAGLDVRDSKGSEYLKNRPHAR